MKPSLNVLSAKAAQLLGPALERYTKRIAPYSQPAICRSSGPVTARIVRAATLVLSVFALSLLWRIRSWMAHRSASRAGALVRDFADLLQARLPLSSQISERRLQPGVSYQFEWRRCLT